MNAFALVEASFALDRLGRRGEAAELLHQCAEAYPKSPWGTAASARLKKQNDRPPHESPEAAALLALDIAPREALDPLGEQQPVEPSVLEDLMDQARDAAILSRPLVMRPIPSPLLRLTLPEPFENRGAVRVRGFSDVEDSAAGRAAESACAVNNGKGGSVEWHSVKQDSCAASPQRQARASRSPLLGAAGSRVFRLTECHSTMSRMAFS